MDDSKNLYPPNCILKGTNIKITTDEGLSNATIGNIIGNQLAITVTGTGYTLAGWCTIKDDIILVYRNSSYILIYKVRQTNETTFILVTNKEIYSGLCSISDKVQIIGRYETEKIQKIYIADENYMIKSFNVATWNNDTECVLTTTGLTSSINYYPSERFNILNEIQLETPVFLNYISGYYPSGMIQYAYRLYNLNGVETNFSECTPLYPLTFYNGTDLRTFQGTSVSTPSGQGLSITISNIDTSFEYIEVISLFYSSKEATPLIRIINKYNNNGSLTFVDTGLEFQGTLTLDEFTIAKNPILAKTLATKNNKLFIGNIKEDVFDFDYDTRIYRYQGSTSALYTTSNTPINGDTRIYITILPDRWVYQTYNSSTTNWNTISTPALLSTIPETHNCINIFNSSFDGTNRYNSTKENAFGVSVLGGSGVNIDLTFGTKVYELEQNIPTEAENRKITTSITQTNEKYIKGIERGFNRGDVYRFGMVGYDKYGRSSYVKWIADIKMPDNHDLPYITEDPIYKTTYGNLLYPIFTFSNVPTEVIDIQIVYVKRDNNDRLVTSTALGIGVDDDNGTPGNYSCMSSLFYPPVNILHLATVRGDALQFTTHKIYELETPDALFNNSTLLFNKINPIGLLEHDFTLRQPIGTPDVGDYDSIVKFRTFTPLVSETYSLPIHEYKKMGINEITSLSDGTTTYPFANVGDDDQSYDVTSSKGTCYIATTPNYFNNTVINSTTKSVLCQLIKTTIQYGGNEYINRQNNIYIPASIRYNKNTSLVLECLQGDTYICYFDYLRCPKIERAGVVQQAMGQEVCYIPLETPYNLYLRNDHSCFKSLSVMLPSPSTDTFVALKYTDYWFTDELVYYKLNNVYNKLNDIQRFIPKPLRFEENKYNHTLVKYSNVKINGEEKDSFCKFGALNFNTLNGQCNELNYLIEFNNEVYCFQDNGVSLAAIDRQESTTGSSGSSLVLGTGSALQRFDYYSTEIGCKDTSTPIVSTNGIYWLDINRKSFYRLTKDIECLSVTKKLNSWFKNTTDDNSTQIGLYNPIDKLVYITVNNIYPNTIASITSLGSNIYRFSFTTSGLFTHMNTYKRTLFRIDDVYKIQSHYYKIKAIDPYYIEVENIDGYTPTGTIDLTEYIFYNNNYTIIYYELLDYFESFYNINKVKYLKNNRAFLSINTTTTELSLYLHNFGDYNKFYTTLYPTKLELVTSGTGQDAYEFTNLNWYSEITNDGVDDPTRTLDSILVENDYQQTRVIPLIPKLNETDILDTEATDYEFYRHIITDIYYVNDVVWNGLSTNIFYICILNTIAGIALTNTTYWIPYKLTNLRLNIRGWDIQVPRAKDFDENLAEILWDGISKYKLNTYYYEGDVVLYKNNRYTCRKSIKPYTGLTYINIGDLVYYTSSKLVYRSITGILNDPPTHVADWVSVQCVPDTGHTNTVWKYDPIFNRMRDTHLISKFTFTNTAKERLTLHNMYTDYANTM